MMNNLIHIEPKKKILIFNIISVSLLLVITACKTRDIENHIDPSVCYEMDIKGNVKFIRSSLTEFSSDSSENLETFILKTQLKYSQNKSLLLADTIFYNADNSFAENRAYRYSNQGDTIDYILYLSLIHI